MQLFLNHNTVACLHSYFLPVCMYSCNHVTILLLFVCRISSNLQKKESRSWVSVSVIRAARRTASVTATARLGTSTCVRRAPAEWVTNSQSFMTFNASHHRMCTHIAIWLHSHVKGNFVALWNASQCFCFIAYNNKIVNVSVTFYVNTWNQSPLFDTYKHHS